MPGDAIEARRGGGIEAYGGHGGGVGRFVVSSIVPARAIKLNAEETT
jgi:hypothetical protein